MKFFVILSAVLFALNPLYAQQDSMKAGEYKNSIQLYVLTVPGLSYTRMLSKTSEIRLSLEADGFFDSYESKSERRHIQDSTLIKRNYESSGDIIDQDIRISAVYNYYMRYGESLRFYAGLGPYIGRGYYSNEQEQKNLDQDDLFRSTNNTKSFSLGISFNTGLEFDISERIALLAEYRLRGERIWETRFNKYTYPDNDRYNEREYNIIRSRWTLDRLRVALVFRL